MESLPPTVLTLVLAALPNPGHVLRTLAVSCRALYRTITEECDGYWEQQAIAAGWSEKREVILSALASDAGPSHPASADTQPVQWFQYYKLRMGIRWRLRRFIRLYTPFLTQLSRIALITPGVSVASLKETEQRLGVALPWELYELYRQVNGQDPGAGITFADTARLLRSDELCVDSVLIASPSVQHQLTEEAGERMSALQIPEHLKQQVGTAQASSSSSGAGSSGRTTHTHSGDPKAIRFAESASGALAFLIDLRSGAVLIRRGLSTVVTAPSLTRFMQKLLT